MSNVRNNKRLELPPEAEPVRDFIEALVSKLTKRIDELEIKAADLQQQLAAKKNTSRNSSKPPSSEHPHAKPTGKNAAARRKNRAARKATSELFANQFRPNNAILSCPAIRILVVVAAAISSPQAWTRYDIKFGNCRRSNPSLPNINLSLIHISEPTRPY